MRQILQSLKTGVTEVADIPCPKPRPGHLLIRSAKTLVSAGTERMLVEFGKGNLVAKARQQPDKVRMVLDKIKTDGLLPTLEAVSNKLDQPLAMGYCNVGRVLAVGAGVSGWAAGERVVSNGKHAEVVNVPAKLCAKVPDAVDDEAAAFTVLGAIALQGIRLVGPTLGEAVVVTGLGLIGLLAAQLLKAHGCRVLGLDFAADKVALARQLGIEAVDLAAGADPVAAGLTFSKGRGVDAVLIAASTASDEPVRQAARMCRKRGRIVLVGVAGLELSRADFYEKELSFQVSCSYGPGRYDPDYEERGQDYPFGFVRWTEQRNFEAVLDMLAEGRIDVAPLVSHRFPIAGAAAAYALVGGAAPSLGIVLDYPAADARPEPELRRDTVTLAAAGPGRVAVGFIGAGNYAGSVLMPAFKAAGARLAVVASSGGVSAVHAARRFGFEAATTAADGLPLQPGLSALVVATRHDSHADWVCRGLAAGRSVFVEKPLALNLDGLSRIEQAHAEALAAGRAPLLMVGFNRRFAPQILKIKALLDAVPGPKAMVMTVNAGAVPPGHWTLDPEVGGGRIIGEGCHFIDLLRHLAGAPIAAWRASRVGGSPDQATLTLEFADGSVGTLHYFAEGHKAVPKERLEIFAGGRVLQLDNFRKLRGHGWPKFDKLDLWRQDKGQKACAAAFVAALERGGAAPIALDELLEVGRITVAIGESLR